MITRKRKGSLGSSVCHQSKGDDDGERESNKIKGKEVPEPPSNSSSDSGNPKETPLFQSLYEICEEAYAGGIDSVEIYEVLHSKVLLDLVQKYAREEKKSKSGQSSLLLRIFKTAHSWLFRMSLFLFTILISTLTIFHFLGMNPLMFFHTLASKQCLLPAHQIFLEMVRPIQDCSICYNYQNMNSVVIEYSSSPTEEEFRKVAYLSRPVIIRGAAFGTGMPVQFNFAKLKNIFESEPGGVDSASDECQFLPFRSPFTTLREAFAQINDTANWDRPWYIGWSNCHPGVAGHLRGIFPRPNFLPSDSESSAIDWIFIGSPGMGAAMHIDYVKRPSWQAQLSGIKQWTLRPVPECEEKCADMVTFTIRPGDILFLDTNVWYHETMILGDNLSISVGSEYD